ncbi:MAG: TerB family tellurite resistance protein, partial [Alphaproteobacteria bacterium]|nr:TerB family tellurite resistance protein [Alphaproteobacteria bacterium]
AFATGIIVLSAKMARAAGRLSSREIDAFRKVFQISPSQERIVSRIFNRARLTPDGFEPFAVRLVHLFGKGSAVLEGVLSSLFIIASSDADISEEENDYLWQVAEIFGFSEEDFTRIAAQSGIGHSEAEDDALNATEAFEILGVSETASADAIKAAYRQLLREHHPDVLMARGMPPEFVDSATEKIKRINAAYTEIRALKGIP